MGCSVISNLIVTGEDFNSLSAVFARRDTGLNWELVFTLPGWMQTWWRQFGSGSELYLRAVRLGEQIIGVAPLQIKANRASIIGSVNVCDYQDFITLSGSEREFCLAVVDDLRRRGVSGLDLEPVRPDSAIVKHLVPLALELGYAVTSRQSDVSLEMDLPGSWEEYLGSLDGKQRHEIRRKRRNLEAVIATEYKVVDKAAAIPGALDTFLNLFPDARQDKAEFMTAPMRSYFQALSVATAAAGIIRFGMLEAGSKTVAALMYFDYTDSVYLYNSAYDAEYRGNSVGIISKVRCIQDSIEKGKRKFDFLKGNEPYKYYLGGKEVPLYSYRIDFER